MSEWAEIEDRIIFHFIYSRHVLLWLRKHNLVYLKVHLHCHISPYNSFQSYLCTCFKHKFDSLLLTLIFPSGYKEDNKLMMNDRNAESCPTVKLYKAYFQCTLLSDRMFVNLAPPSNSIKHIFSVLYCQTVCLSILPHCQSL